jgi:hypothetical protein
MDAVSDRRFGATTSPASVGGPARAGSMSLPYGTPASSVGSTGCSFGVHTGPAPASLWPEVGGCGRTGSRFPVRPQTRSGTLKP